MSKKKLSYYQEQLENHKKLEEEYKKICDDPDVDRYKKERLFDRMCYANNEIEQIKQLNKVHKKLLKYYGKATSFTTRYFSEKVPKFSIKKKTDLNNYLCVFKMDDPNPEACHSPIYIVHFYDIERDAFLCKNHLHTIIDQSNDCIQDEIYEVLKWKTCAFCCRPIIGKSLKFKHSSYPNPYIHIKCENALKNILID